MDPEFVNDTTVYYNLPSSSKHQEGKRRSTLPRPHSSFIFDRSTSCPSSPKLSVFKPKRSNQSSCSQTVNRSVDKSLESSVVSDPSASSCHGKEIQGEPHQVAGPCELLENSEVIYQNVGPSSRKFRKKSSIFPWWKRKKHSHEEVVCATYKLLSSETTGAHSSVCNPDSTTSTEVVKSSQKPISEIQMPSNYLNLPRRTSSCSSSTTTLSDDDENESNTLGESVLGGVSYVKPTKAFVSEDPNNENASSSLPENVSENAELSGKLGHWVREWRRKSRWLSRRIREKNPRHNGEGDLDIAIIHSENDTSIWAEYLNKNFQNLLQDKLGRPQVRVEKINIESFAGYHQVPEVQASRISNAKLQIVILSPGFLSFLDVETELHFEKLLRSNRVLALFLGVTKENLRDGPLALSSLYSFEEWKCFQVRDRDETFVTQVQEESLRILTRCEVFDQCKSYSPFSLCPRKITQSYCRLYIHLKSPLPKGQESQIRVTVDQSPSKCSVSPTVQCHNPFTLSFVMPEKLLGVSSFLKVNLYVEDKYVGSREVKCEGPLEILNDILKTAIDPIELMCQALGISPASDDLDELLAQRVRKKLPLSGPLSGQNKEGRDLACQELPTWLHFSAFYGLENFTWALLDIQSVEKSLLMKNNNGRTPAKLALQSGYTRLAQDLEKLVIVTSLALRTFPHSRRLPGHAKDSFTENYNLVPSNPRPYNPKSYKNLSSYDTPPHPRSLKDITLKDSISTYENVTSTPKCGEIVYANLLRSPSIQFSDESSIKNSRSDHEGEEYLDMSGTSSQFEEYQKDVSILVDAWDKRNDARTFLSEYQHTISKIKNNFHFKAPTIGDCAPSPIPEESEYLEPKDKGATGGSVEKWFLRFLKRNK